MSAHLLRLADLVHRRTGIAPREHGLPALIAALERAVPGVDAERFLAAVEGDEAAAAPLLDRLVEEVTVKETYFNRAPRELEAVDWQALWSAARARGTGMIRVWIPACATGEEPYTLAMLAIRAFGPLPPPVQILATDISPRALAAAQAGLYSERSVRSLPPEMIERHFTRQGPRYALDERVKAMVAWRTHNLISDGPPCNADDAFSLVSCRNVLIYFDPPTVEQVIAMLRRAVAPGGALILGAADRVAGTVGALAQIKAGAPSPQPARAAARRPSRTLPSAPRRREPVVPDAPAATDADDLSAAIALAANHPLDPEAQFVRGLAELGTGDPGAAMGSFRRALYLDPAFGLAAFQLGRSHDALGDVRAGRRAYAQALQLLDPLDDRQGELLGQVEVADVVGACRARLRELGRELSGSAAR